MAAAAAINFPAAIELVSRITSTSLPVLGDRIQLQQVILNLVVNGIDAIRDRPSLSRVISIRTSRAENFAVLSVSDRGWDSRRQTKRGLRAVFTPARPKAWAWDCPSRVPLSRRTAERYRQKIGITVARLSASSFHLSNNWRFLSLHSEGHRGELHAAPLPCPRRA